jgi:Lrp/AsnC family transcriptional regulator, leucine-responsive regulatory protein
MEMDIDRKILEMLLNDDKIPFARVAKKLKVAPATVKKVYEELIEKGDVLRESVLLDLSKLGYCGKIYLMITTALKQDKASTMNLLKKVKDVFVVGEIVGDSDLLAVAMISDYDSIKTVVNEVRKIDNVEKVEITILNDVKFPINACFDEEVSKILAREISIRYSTK